MRAGAQMFMNVEKFSAYEIRKRILLLLKLTNLNGCGHKIY